MAQYYISPRPMNFSEALLFSRFNTRIYLGTAPPSLRQITVWAQALRHADISDPVWIGRWTAHDDPHAVQHCYIMHTDGESHIVADADPDMRHLYISSRQVETEPPPPPDAAAKAREAQMYKYLVKRTDGTLQVIAAERYRQHDGSILFEIRNYDQNLPAEQQWRTVTSLPAADVERITVTVRPVGHPGPVASSPNGQDPSVGAPRDTGPGVLPTAPRGDHCRNGGSGSDARYSTLTYG